MSDIQSEEQAQEALFTAMQTDANAPTEWGVEGAGAAPASSQAEVALEAQRAEASTQTNQDNSQGTTTEVQQTSPEATDSFTRLDPDAIPEDLKPWYQSMQADYTRKTQAIAEQRKQLEAIGDIEASQQALQFYQSLQDPTFAKNFHEQLGTTLTNLGYLEKQEAVQQAKELEQTQALVDSSGYQDPEEFFRAKAQELDAKYAAIEQRLEEQRVAAEQAQIYAALAGEVQRQEAYIRDANPHYTDADLDAIHAMTNSDRTLIQAQEIYEAAVAERLNRMMAAKTNVANTHGQPANAGSAVEPPSFGDDLNAAHKAAQERLAQILANES